MAQNKTKLENTASVGVYYDPVASVSNVEDSNHKWMDIVSDLNFQDLFQSLPGNYIVLEANDPDFTILAQNESHAKAVYAKPDDVIGLPVLVAFPDTSESYVKHGKSDLLESFRKVMRTKKPDMMPVLRYDIAKPDGTLDQRYWRLSHYPFFDKNGKLAAIVQKNEDITREILAQKKLDTAQQQLQEILSVGLVGSWMWDLEHNRIICDDTLAKLFGLDPAQAAEGITFEEITKSIHPKDRDRVVEKINTALKNKKGFEEEYRTISNDGTRRWVLARGHFDDPEENGTQFFAGVVIDITERKTTELNLTYLHKASSVLASSLDYKKTLQKIAQLAVPDIADWCTVDILNEKNEIQLVALAHREPEKVKWAIELREAQGPPNLDEPTGVAKVIRTGEPEFYPLITDDLLEQAADPEQVRLLRAIGMTSVMIVPLMDGSTPFGAITLISAELKRKYNQSDLDMATEIAHRASLAMVNAQLYKEAQYEILERKRLEEELVNMNAWLEEKVKERTEALEATNRNLERSNRELEDFAYVASHDLQEPLRKIQAFSDLLRDHYSKELGDGKDYLERMHKAAARMSNLIQDLLSFSRVTTKGEEFKNINLHTVATDVVGDLENRITTTGGEVHIGTLPTIQADPTQMRQLFQNLIGNALKFHKPEVPPMVKITATKKAATAHKPASVIIKIADNGVGFDEKYLDRIFAVFQRLHGREAYEGTGIGLAVCRKIVERHDGAINAKSTPGKGTTFIVTLPIKHKKENK